MTVVQWLELMQSYDSDMRRTVEITLALVESLVRDDDADPVRATGTVSALLAADRIFQLRGEQ